MKHCNETLQKDLISNYLKYVWFEDFTAVAMMRSIHWNVTPCSPVKVNRRFEAIIASIFRLERQYKQ
jgi:hypothetical protein